MFSYPKSTGEWAAVLGIGVSCSVLVSDTYFGVPDPWFYLAAASVGICTAGLAYARRSWRIGLLGTVVLSQIQHHSSPPVPGSVGVFFAIVSYVVLVASAALSARANGSGARREGDVSTRPGTPDSSASH